MENIDLLNQKLKEMNLEIASLSVTFFDEYFEFLKDKECKGDGIKSHLNDCDRFLTDNMEKLWKLQNQVFDTILYGCVTQEAVRRKHAHPFESRIAGNRLKHSIAVVKINRQWTVIDDQLLKLGFTELKRCQFCFTNIPSYLPNIRRSNRKHMVADLIVCQMQH